MMSCLRTACKALLRMCAVLTLVTVAACDVVPLQTGGGPRIDASAPVPVALLVPGGSGVATDELLAANLQNAARLAIADLGEVKIDLRVYNTAANPAQAQAQAAQAISDGAKIILGPLYAQEAVAVGAAAASAGVNVLSFSNNPDVAGGNVFILSPTFQNIASRLSRYAVRQGKRRILIVHDRNLPGQIGRAAIEAGVQSAGGTVAGVQDYEVSQSGIVASIPTIAAAAQSSAADAVFFTSTTDVSLPLVTQLLSENGVSPANTQFIGLTRWDIPAATLTLPGVQGGWFTLPDPGLAAQYQARYQTAYGQAPHPISGLAYDGIAAIGALVRSGNANALTGAALTQGAGFAGVNGVFRLRGDGTNERGLAIATIRNNQVVVIDPAPRSFGGAGS